MADTKFLPEGTKCVVFGTEHPDPHHIYTQGAYPKAPWLNEPWNIIPIAHALHVRWHEKGSKYMTDLFPPIKKWMLDNGWEWDKVSKKWWHEK